MNRARIEIDRFADDFLKGQKDAAKGIPHQAGKSEAYDKGYAAQYEAEAMKDETTRRAWNEH